MFGKPLSETSVADLPLIIEQGLCMGCGICSVSLEAGDVPVQMKLDPDRGHFIPVIESSKEDGSACICPGASIDMPELSRQVYGKLPKDPLVGQYLAIRAASAVDNEIRRKAASGGMIPAILKYLFDTGEIDMAYCVRAGENALDARGVIIKSGDDLSDISGSVYHPVNFGASLNDLINLKTRFAFVGLPCEIAGLEMLKAKLPDLSERHVLSIGLFCGGVNTLDGIDYYLRSFDISMKEVRNIEYRYGDWPGKIRLWLKSTGEEKIIPRIRGNSRWKILRYVVAFQGYWMLKRCRMCPDQISDFADISVGDPHLPRFRQAENQGVSAVVTRTHRGEDLMQSLIEGGVVKEESLSRDELVTSQGYTLDNRRHVLAYLRVGKWLGLKTPQLETYSELSAEISFRHYVYAWVDLMKVALSGKRWLMWLYIPWQIFEYLFITFTPSLIVKRFVKLVRNR